MRRLFQNNYSSLGKALCRRRASERGAENESDFLFRMLDTPQIKSRTTDLIIAPQGETLRVEKVKIGHSDAEHRNKVKRGFFMINVLAHLIRFQETPLIS